MIWKLITNFGQIHKQSRDLSGEPTFNPFGFLDHAIVSDHVIAFPHTAYMQFLLVVCLVAGITVVKGM